MQYIQTPLGTPNLDVKKSLNEYNLLRLFTFFVSFHSPEGSQYRGIHFFTGISSLAATLKLSAHAFKLFDKSDDTLNTLFLLLVMGGFKGLILGRMASNSVPFSLANSRLNEEVI